MANDVFANGRDVSCKTAEGKSIASFPDVCLSPPSPPAGPVPIPYPNTGMASDTTDGSKTVLIGGQEVMLKDKSCFQKSTGDEAATKSQGMGVVTHQITGKVYFKSWSMDVMIECENAVRHLDLMTHNHMSDPGNTPPWAYTDTATPAPIKSCTDEVERKDKACAGKTTKGEQCADKGCKDAKKCLLVSKDQADSKAKDSTVACCPGETGHHIVEAHGFTVKGTKQQVALPQFPKYDAGKAPCVCAECPQDGSGRYEGDHGILHSINGKLEQAAIESTTGRKDYAWTYGQARSAGVRSVQQTFPKSKCSRKCLQAQLDAYHEDTVGAKRDTPVRTETPKLSADQKDLSNVLVPEITLSKW
jgi:hypothetical protein